MQLNLTRPRTNLCLLYSFHKFRLELFVLLHRHQTLAMARNERKHMFSILLKIIDVHAYANRRHGSAFHAGLWMELMIQLTPLEALMAMVRGDAVL